MKVELNEQAKQELIYIQKYFKEKTGKHNTLSHLALVAVTNFYNVIRSKESSNAEEQEPTN
jgi:hypothetical protein